MANYDTLAPTLPALNSVLTTPADNESAAKWPAVDRQTRNWVYNFLLQYFDSTTGKLKPAAYGDGTIPIGTVRGTNPTNGVGREIVQASIQGADIAAKTIDSGNLKDNCIIDSLLAAEAISGTKIKVNSIPADRLQAQSISGSALGNAIVQAIHLATNAVTPDKIQDLAVATSKVQTRAIIGDRLEECPEGYIMVGGSTVNGNDKCAKPKQLSGGATIDKDGVVTIAATAFSNVISFARIVEKNGSGTGAGTSNLVGAAIAGYAGHTLPGTYGYCLDQPWQARGMGAPWTVLNAQAIVKSIDLVVTVVPNRLGNGISYDFTVPQKRIYIQQPGTYLIFMEIPGLACGNHRARLNVLPDVKSLGNLEYYLGSVAQAASSTETTSTLVTLVTFAAPDAGQYPYMYVDWRADIAIANGMGYPSAYGIDENFGSITMIRLA